MAERDEGQYDASSYGSNGYGGQQSAYDNNSFKFVCINNNNNTVVEEKEEPPTPIPPVVDECAEAGWKDIEACFEENLLPEDFLSLTASSLENGIDVIIEREVVTLNSFADICEALKGITTWEQLFTAVLIITDEFSDPTAPVAISNDLIDCIAEALGIPLPSPPPGG